MTARWVGAGGRVLPRISVTVGLLSMLFGMRLSGQILHATGPRPSFQVATIKPSPATETRSAMGFSAGGRGFFTTNATLRDLIQEAYNVKSTGQIEGATGWMTTEKFDIDARMDNPQAVLVAKLPIGERVDQVRFMLQSLLEERFALKLSESSRQSSFFTLVVAKGGPKLKPAEMAPADPNGSDVSHPTIGSTVVRRGPGRLEVTGASMGLLTEMLSRQPELGGAGGFALGELVVDKTGLSGIYDWTLTWTPDPLNQGGEAAVNAGAPSLFTALQEQLGLKLEKEKGQVEVLVIDHAERPTAN